MFITLRKRILVVLGPVIQNILLSAVVGNGKYGGII